MLRPDFLRHITKQNKEESYSSATTIRYPFVS